MVSCWPSTLKVWFLSQGSPHEICGEQNGIGTSFSFMIKFSPINIILPMLHTHLCLQAAGIRRTGRQGLGTLKSISALPEMEGIGKNSTVIFFHQVHVVYVSAHIVNEFFNGPRCLHVHDFNFELTLNTLE